MKQKNKRRFVCLFLAFTLLIFAACTATEDVPESSLEQSATPDSTVSEISKEVEGWIDGLENPGDKYANREYVIVTTNKALFSSGSDTMLGKAIDKRRHLLMEKYGITITISEQSAADITRGLRDAAEEGSKYADLICAPADILANLSTDDLLENIHSLPCIDFDAGYMPRAEIEEQTVGNTMYCFSGSITMAANECYAVFCNKSMLDVSKTVGNGRWTWGVLKNSVDEMIMRGEGGLASTVEYDDLTVAVYNSSGAKLLNNTDGGLVRSYNDAAAEATRKIMQGLFPEGEISIGLDREKVLADFAEGKISMFIGKIGDVEMLDKAKQEWGILPLPKHSQEQNGYYTPVCGTASAIAVPKNCGDSAFAGTMLNALFAATADSLEEALKLTYVNYYFWSNDSALMFYRICDRKIYDLGNIYSRFAPFYDVGKALLLSDSGETPDENAIADFETSSKTVFVRY